MTIFAMFYFLALGLVFGAVAGLGYGYCLGFEHCAAGKPARIYREKRT